MSKVYFNHTTKNEAVKQRLVPPATIALKRVGNTFHYGVAICSMNDNYDKAQGRAIAEQRMEEGFRVTAIPEELLKIESVVGECAMTRSFLYQISTSLVVNSRRWRKKVTRFNMERQETGKIVAMKTRIQVSQNQPA